MFNKETLERVARDVIDVVEMIFERLLNNRERELLTLEAAGKELSEESELIWVRQEADEAWKAHRYKEAAKLYKKLGSVLSRSEVKRLEVAEKLSRRS
jgi:hypothetical protein